ncbi:MAG: esterase/lipase family protein [Burkholderiales bacterium]
MDSVLVVHGLWLHGLVMAPMARRIRRCGFSVHAYSYPTVRLSLTENARRLAGYCERLSGKLHFVGHSMGSLVALEAARLVPEACRGRVVMIGPPYADSYSARCVERWPGGRAILGKSICEWIAGAHPEAADCEVGVIAGTGGIGLGRAVAPRLPRPNDGVIALSETVVPGMRDRIVLPVSHTAMVLSRVVAHQTCTFLKEGRFDRAHEAAA